MPSLLRKSIHGALVVTALVGSLLTQALGIEKTPELQKVVDGAKAEGALKIKSIPDVLAGPEGVKAAVAWMKSELGLEIDGRWGPDPAFAQQAAKIFTEMQAGQKASTDVYTATAVQITPMLPRGLFETVAWEKLLPGRITSAVVEADGRALRILTQTPGILYNKRLLPQVPTIQSMTDLLKPEFKGKYTTTPYLAGFDVLVSPEVWGMEKTTDFVTKMSNQISGLLLCGANERIASGEHLALALDCAGAEHNRTRYGDVLGLHVVPDNAQRRYTYITIPKNAKNPNTAILFALYMSTPAGQKFVWDAAGFNLDTYPDSLRRKEIEAAEARGIKFRDVSIAWWEKQQSIAQQHTELIKIIQRR